MDAEPCGVEDDELLRAVAPFVQGAALAAAAGEMGTVAAAWCRIVALGRRAMLVACTALGEMAILGVKAPEHGELVWSPSIRHHATGEPVDVNDPEHAAVAFVGRFCGAAMTKDRALQQDLFGVFLPPEPRDQADAPGVGRAADAFAMLAQCAANGIARERERRARAHQHPNARHAGRRARGRGRR